MPRGKVLREIVLEGTTESSADRHQTLADNHEEGDKENHNPEASDADGEPVSDAGSPNHSEESNGESEDVAQHEEVPKASLSNSNSRSKPDRKPRTAAQLAALEKANNRRLELQKERLTMNKREMKELLDSVLREHLVQPRKQLRSKKRVQEFSSEEDEVTDDTATETEDGATGNYKRNSKRVSKRARAVGDSRVQFSGVKSRRSGAKDHRKSASTESSEQPATSATSPARAQGRGRGGGRGGRGGQGSGGSGTTSGRQKQFNGSNGSGGGNSGGANAGPGGGYIPSSGAQKVPAAQSKPLTRDEKLYSMIFQR